MTWNRSRPAASPPAASPPAASPPAASPPAASPPAASLAAASLAAACCLALALPGSPGAANLAVVHSFSGDRSVDVTLAVTTSAPVLLPGPGGRAIDGTDYSGVGTLSLRRDVLVASAGGDVSLPAGRYAVDFAPHGPRGLPVATFRREDGARLAATLVVTSRADPDGGSPTLQVVGEAGPGDPWLVAVHFADVSGLLAFRRPGGEGDVARPSRRSRRELIRERVAGRAPEPRRRSRVEQR